MQKPFFPEENMQTFLTALPFAVVAFLLGSWVNRIRHRRALNFSRNYDWIMGHGVALNTLTRFIQDLNREKNPDVRLLRLALARCTGLLVEQSEFRKFYDKAGSVLQRFGEDIRLELLEKWIDISTEAVRRADTATDLVRACINCPSTYRDYDIAVSKLKNNLGGTFNNLFQVAAGSSGAMSQYAARLAIDLAENPGQVELLWRYLAEEDTDKAWDKIAKLEDRPEELAEIVANAPVQSSGWRTAVTKLLGLHEPELTATKA